MTQRQPNSHCPLCDSEKIEMRHDYSVRFRYLKKEHILDGQEHTVCGQCGTSFFLPGQIERNNLQFLAFESKVVKGIAPREIRTLREIYDISQDQACRIFHCGPTAFSKWERGEVAPTGPTVLLLRMAIEDPELMRKLANLAGETVDLHQEPSAPRSAVGKTIKQVPRRQRAALSHTIWKISDADWEQGREFAATPGNLNSPLIQPIGKSTDYLDTRTLQ